MKIGTGIKKVRVRKGINQSELAKLSGISNVTISIIEKNATIPNLKTLHKIADVLEVNPVLFYFIGLEVDDIPKEKQETFLNFYPIIVQMLEKLL